MAETGGIPEISDIHDEVIGFLRILRSYIGGCWFGTISVRAQPGPAASLNYRYSHEIPAGRAAHLGLRNDEERHQNLGIV